jgi:hypothetical protein
MRYRDRFAVDAQCKFVNPEVAIREPRRYGTKMSVSFWTPCSRSIRGQVGIAMA